MTDSERLKRIEKTLALILGTVSQIGTNAGLYPPKDAKKYKIC